MLKIFNKITSITEVRFLFVGILNTAVGYGLYALFIFWGIQYFISNTLSFILGTIHSYLWNKFYTFKSKEKSIQEPIRFTSIYLIVFALSNFLLWLFIEKLYLNAYIAGGIGLFFTTIISFTGHKYFSFKYKSDTQN